MRVALRPASVMLALLAALLVGAAGRAQDRDIEVGAYVSSLSDIRPDDGSYRVVLFAWFNDPAGRFDATRDLYVNARTSSVTEIDRETTPGGGSYSYVRIDALVSDEFAFQHFPFDRQTLTLRLEPEESTDTLRFVPDAEDTGASPDLQLIGWQLEGVRIGVEERTYESDFGYWTGAGAPYSQVVLSIDVARHRSPVLVDDFLGFTFAFLVTSLGFFVSCTELGLRVGMSTGSLFAAVVNLNRLHDAAGFRPEFGLVDRLAFLVLGTVLFALVIAIGTNRLSKRDVARANRIDTLLGIVLVAVFGTMIFVTLRASLA